MKLKGHFEINWPLFHVKKDRKNKQTRLKKAFEIYHLFLVKTCGEQLADLSHFLLKSLCAMGKFDNIETF